MPVVWLLRYANRTSNLKTALTRKYRIINHTRLYQLHLATNWESNSQTSVVIRIVCINSVKLQLDYDIHLLGSCNNLVLTVMIYMNTAKQQINKQSVSRIFGSQLQTAFKLIIHAEIIFSNTSYKYFIFKIMFLHAVSC
jgi:hypothetical protein